MRRNSNNTSNTTSGSGSTTRAEASSEHQAAERSSSVVRLGNLLFIKGSSRRQGSGWSGRRHLAFPDCRWHRQHIVRGLM